MTVGITSSMTTLNFLTKPIGILLGVAFITLEATGAATAAVFTFDTSDSPFTAEVRNQGWWSPEEGNSDTNDRYFVGTTEGTVFRNFFTFDISSLPTEPIVSATLELKRFNSTAVNPTETLNLFDVSTDARTLNSNTRADAAIFNDLGTGLSYGTFEVSTSFDYNPTEVLSFSLNSAAIADIQSARNAGQQFFSIGGSLLNLPPGPPEYDQYLFAGSGSDDPFEPAGTQRLTVTTVPEPSTTLGSLMLLGFGVFMKTQQSMKRKKFYKKLVSS